MSRSTVSRLEFAVHAAFFLVVIGSLWRLFAMNTALCFYVLGLSILLSGGYAATVWAGNRLGWWQVPVIALVTGVWVLLISTVPAPYSSVYSWLAIPLACLMLRTLPPRPAMVAVGIVTGLLVAVLYRQSGDLDLFLPPAAAVWATVALYAGQQRDTAIRQKLVEQLRSTRDELAQQQHDAGILAERARLAGELHDTITQELVGSRMLLQAADREWDTDPAKARQRVRGVTETLGQNVVQARRMIAGLTPAALEEGGIEAALEELCRREQRYGPTVALTTTGEPRVMNPELESALLRTAQGALANVRDHAGADRIEVVLDWQDESVRLQISDNGNGVQDRAAGPDRGFGLPGLRERLRTLGGTLTLDSTPGRGTALTASVPTG
ncbi:sensor histidine kinase [Kribbella sp. CA-294648]|uniref:sensor histidine kinase n=1 Tax=Kribbella sp. CA-294648 TaxID=3239948 RepID=UPI003D8EB8DC